MESFRGPGGGDVSELGSLVQEWTMLTDHSALYLLVSIIPRRNVDSSYYSYYIGTGKVVGRVKPHSHKADGYPTVAVHLGYKVGLHCRTSDKMKPRQQSAPFVYLKRLSGPPHLPNVPNIPQSRRLPSTLVYLTYIGTYLSVSEGSRLFTPIFKFFGPFRLAQICPRKSTIILDIWAAQSQRPHSVTTPASGRGPRHRRLSLQDLRCPTHQW
jgi:hypothetical protein